MKKFAFEIENFWFSYHSEDLLNCFYVTFPIAKNKPSRIVVTRFYKFLGNSPTINYRLIL